MLYQTQIPIATTGTEPLAFSGAADLWAAGLGVADLGAVGFNAADFGATELVADFGAYVGFDLTTGIDQSGTVTYTAVAEVHLIESSNTTQAVLELNVAYSDKTGQTDLEGSEGDVDPP